MDPTIAATVIGVLLTTAFGAFVTMLAWLRSDTNARFDKMDEKFDKVDDRFDKVDARFERLEAKVDSLILGLTRRGFLTDPEGPSGADD